MPAPAPPAVPFPRRRRRPGPRPYTLRQWTPGRDDDFWEDDCYSEPEITTGDVADLLGVKQATVRRWVARGYIRPIRKLGTTNVFRTEEVFEAYEQIAARRKATAGPRRRRGRYLVEPRLID